MSKWLLAAKANTMPPDKTDFTDKALNACTRGAEAGRPEEVSSVLSVLSEANSSNIVSAASSPALALIEVLQTDMDIYAEALRVHGPMSYGQAMHALSWGGSRAAKAEADLRKAGRIEFNKLGRAVWIEDEDAE